MRINKNLLIQFCYENVVYVALLLKKKEIELTINTILFVKNYPKTFFFFIPQLVSTFNHRHQILIHGLCATTLPNLRTVTVLSPLNLH